MSQSNQPVDGAKLRALLSSPEVRELAALLDRASGGSLQQAAQSARAGDATGLTELVKRLGTTPEGARLLERLQGKLGK